MERNNREMFGKWHPLLCFSSINYQSACRSVEAPSQNNKTSSLEIGSSRYRSVHFQPTHFGGLLLPRGLCIFLKYAIDSGGTLGSEASSVASQAGHLDCLQVLADHGCQFNRNILDQAARNGRLEVVKYLIQNLIEPSMVAMRNAVLSGNVELVKFLNESESRTPQNNNIHVLTSFPLDNKRSR